MNRFERWWRRFKARKMNAKAMPGGRVKVNYPEYKPVHGRWCTIIGKVNVHYYRGFDYWAVKIDSFKDQGHNCDGLCTDNDGWYLFTDEMDFAELTEEEKREEAFHRKVTSYVDRELR